MAGFWPSSFFACLWTEMESRPKLAKKRMRVSVFVNIILQT